MHLEIFLTNISAIVIQAWHSKIKTITLLHKIACISMRKFPKLTSETQVSFVNEAPGMFYTLVYDIYSSSMQQNKGQRG
jgi:hypothetical protein